MSWGNSVWSETPDDILRKSLPRSTILSLLKENPELFDFTNIETNEKVTLLLEHYDIFKDIIEIDTMPTAKHVELFIRKPTKFAKFLNLQKLSGPKVSKIAEKRPSLVKHYGLPLIRLSSDAWKRLIAYDRGVYMDEFAKALPEMTNKTEVRKVIRKHPILTSLITVDQMDKSPLTAKEWILLLDTAELIDKDAKYSNTVNKWLREELTITILSGDDNNTRELKLAMTHLI